MTRRLHWIGWALALGVVAGAGFGGAAEAAEAPVPIDAAGLRAAYAGPPSSWPAPDIDSDVAFVELGAASPSPATSPMEADRVALGARLFQDSGLSADGRVSCASCHAPEQGFSVATPVARGVGGIVGRRNPPALFTVSLQAVFDWDGRGSDLAQRALAPLTAPDEMGNGTLDVVLARLAAAADAVAFERLFPGEGVSARSLGAALVAFLSTLDQDSRFDRFARGDGAALSDPEIEGLHLFRTKARCANCHFGPRLSDGLFYNLRLSFFGEKAADVGRYAVTGRTEDVGQFRTASLRHICASAPYMRNGLFPTLDGVVNFYDRGGGEVWARNAREAAHPLYRHAARASAHLRPLGLAPQEKAALVAFLRSL
ncbi:cytochrome-c peroxidase [Xanthobacter agilis]|uniref:Cytochrome c peroxidase n=1 Tax=Xanthobacter agilis TaxID=47492 RepID=A0ABU0LAG2_XANAG|nr:cytochrome c peroxidase [Xanthobacter agilis]MDQ0504125.1 cytochrome c peroxidase [Xanthobacter agilis]